MLSLTGLNKVFIVTGGSEGIGKGITQAIAAERGIPVIATKSEGPTESLLSELKAKGIDAMAIYGDLQEVDQCRVVIEKTIEKYGRIDGLVNNAGVNDGASLEKGPEAFRISIQRNLYHYFDLAHFALPHLKESKGSIINIASKVALTGQGNTSGYAAAKGAQVALTREWAASLLPYSIRVNAILPAEVMTPLYRRWLDTSFENPAEKEAQIVSRIPLKKRMTKIEEIAAMAVFLLSEVSAHTTGQLMSVDGGYVHLDRALT